MTIDQIMDRYDDGTDDQIEIAAEVRRLRDELKTAGDMYVKVWQSAANMRERELVLMDALERIAKVEQSHCYCEPNGSEVNEMFQTRHDLRKCGDFARAALEAVKE